MITEFIFVIVQVDHVGHLLSLSPFAQLMNMQRSGSPVYKFPARFYSESVEPRSQVSIAVVKLDDPLINVSDLLQSVPVSWWGCPVVWEPA